MSPCHHVSYNLCEIFGGRPCRKSQFYLGKSGRAWLFFRFKLLMEAFCHHVIMSSCHHVIMSSFRKIARTGLSSEKTRTADPLVACLILNFWSPKIEEALVDEMPTSVLNRKFIFWTLASHVHRRPIPWHFLVCRENCFVNRDCSPNPPFPLHLLGLVG